MGLSGTFQLSPVVWWVKWPADIQANVVSFQNPTGTITNLDLEMTGMLLHFLVLKHIVALCHVHVAPWCDSTPTVSRTNKLSRLTHALALRLHTNEASHLVSVFHCGHQQHHGRHGIPHLQPTLGKFKHVPYF
jgi:hypothetical protein